MANMFASSLNDSSGLVARYDFSADNIKQGLAGPNGIPRVSRSGFMSTVTAANGHVPNADMTVLWSTLPSAVHAY